MSGILVVKEGEKKKRQIGRCVPIGILVSAAAAASFIGEIAKPIFKNVFDETKTYC